MKAKINDILPDEEVFTLVDGDPKKTKNFRNYWK